MFYVHVYSPKDDDVSELIREIFGDGELLEKEQEENGDEMEMNCGMRHGTNYYYICIYQCTNKDDVIIWTQHSYVLHIC